MRCGLNQLKPAHELHPGNHAKPLSEQIKVLDLRLSRYRSRERSKKKKKDMEVKNSYADKTRVHKSGSLSIKFKFVLVKLVGSRFVTLKKISDVLVAFIV